MSRDFKLILATIGLAFWTGLMAGCAIEPSQTVSTGVRNDVKLQMLFEHDGCKIYRFNDGGDYIYYADCRGNGGSAPTSWQRQEGKTSVPVVVQTIQGK